MNQNINQTIWIRRAKKLVSRIFQHFDCPELINKTLVTFSYETSTWTGRATWYWAIQQGLIRLSESGWVKNNNTKRNRTIRHEACHIIQFYTIGSHCPTEEKAHNGYWQFLMDECCHIDSQFTILS